MLSPHATIFTRTQGSGETGEPRLALGIEATRDILPEEVGTMSEVREVAAAVYRCLKQAGITDPADVHYVQVKGPLLTPATIADKSPPCFAKSRQNCSLPSSAADPMARLA